MFMKKNKGFTLTELMIALSIVGILVAIVTPAIMKSRPNKNKMMIKKTFYTTEQIVASLINNEMLYPDMRDGCIAAQNNPDEAADNCYWGFDYDKQVNYEGENYSGQDKFKNLFIYHLNTKPNENLTGDQISTRDGVLWDFSEAKGKWTPNQQNGPADAGQATITIDVNGNDGPNCKQTDTGCDENNFDQYSINVMANGKISIDQNDTMAAEYITINTSLGEAMN